MALLTLHDFVLASEGKIRFVVVKFRSRGEGVRGVAFRTVVGQCLLVVVFVAIDAGGAQTEIGFASFFQFPVLDVIGQMAFAAIRFPVGAGQFVAGEVVVEVFFIKTHHVEIAAVVVAVAGSTFLTPHLARCMITRSFYDPAIDFLMAGEAFIVGDFLAQHMALGTV